MFYYAVYSDLYSCWSRLLQIDASIHSPDLNELYRHRLSRRAAIVS